MAAQVTFDDRWLAEATRLRDQDDASSSMTFDHPANLQAREAGGELETRITHRAANLPNADALRQGRQHTRQMLGLVISTAVVVALLAGAGAARTVLSRGEPPQPVFFFEVLATLLGLQTLLLLAWPVLMFIRPAGRALGGVSLGSIVLALARRLTSALHRDADHTVAVTATFSILFNRSIGQWTISAISHGMWLAFNMACLVVITLLLSVHEYSFVWQTTILDRSEYQALTRTISVGPRFAGFGPLPTDEDVARSEWTNTTESSRPDAGSILPMTLPGLRQKWSALLVGCLVMYGLAPRLLLLGFSLSMRRAACRRWRLELSHAYYVRLERVLMPSRRSVPSVDDDPDSTGQIASEFGYSEPAQATADRDADGPPMIAGIELPDRPSDWPPRLHNVRWQDAGFIETGDDRHRLLNDLRQVDSLPRSLVLVVSLATTPDRGIERFVTELHRTYPGGLWLVLTGGQALRDRQRPDALDQRLDVWHALADRAGIDPSRVREIDLGYLTDVTAQMLGELIDRSDDKAPTGNARPSSDRHIEAAFALIVDDARSWYSRDDAPDQAAVVDLHRRIGKLYCQTHATWSELLLAPRSVLQSLPGRLEDSARRAVDLLPDRLRSSARWMTAGAIAGAVGCVASAALLSPAAISALPMWAGVGGGLTAVIDLYRRRGASGREDQDDNQSVPTHEPADTARIDAVRAAVLFTILLESQGYPEATITRLLDAALSTDVVDAIPDTAESLDRWLDDVRHRYDQALVQEMTS